MGVRIAQGPKHRLLWTIPKDIVRLCEPQPGQPHLGQAGPEGQVPLRMAQKRHSPGPQARTGPGPGALGPESRFLPQITLIRRKGDGRRRITGSPGFSGVLRAAGETIISEYSIFYGTLLPSAYTPKRWVDPRSKGRLANRPNTTPPGPDAITPQRMDAQPH